MAPTPELDYLRWLRRAQYGSGSERVLARLVLARKSARTHIQIPYAANIGKGLYLGHHGTFVVNPGASIGDNCNLQEGVVIGQTNRGRSKGCPSIGNEVWIGSNAVVVGAVTVGDDVLIAPNAYVNFDVPPHSVVIGNPATVHHREHAMEGYINRKV